jgi:hypothetical protein
MYSVFFEAVLNSAIPVEFSLVRVWRSVEN